ncbi:MAG: sulfurtransferase [Acidimicrobiia bacterium]|nr:MAG: sulfurtransferase [Acidimicrobiia bacterium]
MANPLITVEELKDILGNEDMRVVDCRWYLGNPDGGSSAYHEGHIQGAMFASLDTELSGDVGPGRHPLPSPDDFAKFLARLGISPSTTVVTYDDRGGAVASRLWWMLTDQGHKRTSVLDGGIQAWISDGQALATDEGQPQVGTFRTRPWRDIVDRRAVVSRKDNALLIDARALERYRGEEEPVDPKAGHIPGAISLPQTGNLADELTFLPPGVLRSRFANIGITGRDTVISHCGSGVTACHNILAMEVAGIRRPLLYVGSWSDWSSTDLPVATGQQP